MQNDTVHPKKIFAVISVARQVDGEFVVIKTEKAFKRASAADEYAKKLATNYSEVIQTASGPIQCVCERGVFEMDVEE
jgi:acetamidase/formamidase